MKDKNKHYYINGYKYYIYGEEFSCILHRDKPMTGKKVINYVNGKYKKSIVLVYECKQQKNELISLSKHSLTRFYILHPDYLFKFYTLDKYITEIYGDLECRVLCHGKRKFWVLVVTDMKREEGDLIALKNLKTVIPVAVFRKIPRKLPKELVNLKLDDYSDHHVVNDYLKI